ncbi:hypothetical protein UY3_04178 [Chelonia mydas]|uniref:Uncharacterized protein n=1 Tax=Chelonia mydas TaxID=8469 RepID=M7CCX3_CHEMY|nr:hypothetical protein UY3_04178 [Chelonia mydas]
MDTSQVCECKDNKEDDMVDKEEEEEQNGRQASSGSILPKSQEIFLTLKPCGSQDITVADREAGEGISADTELRAWRISLSEKLDMGMESRKASNEYECVAQDEMLRIMRDQADILRCLVELREQKQEATAHHPIPAKRCDPTVTACFTGPETVLNRIQMLCDCQQQL